MQRKRLFLNTLTSLIFQIVTIVCGFILPRLILESFGSDTNGLVNSITQFLQIIAFLELGVGAVVQSALYRPLVEKDNNRISKIVVSANSFFKNLARILFVYVICMIMFYPFIIKNNYGWLYTATLIMSMSISSFAQYYFGVVDRLLLTADQHGYIQYSSQSVTLIINTIACVILINAGSSIQLVKLTTSLIYLLRPIYLRWYVNNNYLINRRITYSEEPIKQKWNGVAQHIAAVVLDSTDTIILTIFSTLTNVSIYSIYYLVISGVKQLTVSSINGVQSLFGELLAERKRKELTDLFGKVEWIIHTGTTFIFGCTGFLIVSFVHVYTLGIHDANYYQPIFAIVFTIANAGYCLRLPYNIMILAGGHYKQTQRSYVIATLLNVIFSILFVKLYGLVGVAIGTLIAMYYQTVWMALYNSNNFINWPFKKFIKQLFIDILTVLIGSALTVGVHYRVESYFEWVLFAFRVAIIWLIVILVINSIFNKDRIISIFKKFKLRF